MKLRAVLGILPLLLSGCTAPIIHERSVALDPGAGFAEVNLLIEDGQEVSWDWTITGGNEVHFDVHSHGPGGVTEHVTRMNVTSDSDSFAAPTAGSYSLYWENLGSKTLVLHYKVTGEARLDPGHPPMP